MIDFKRETFEKELEIHKSKAIVLHIFGANNKHVATIYKFKNSFRYIILNFGRDVRAELYRSYRAIAIVIYLLIMIANVVSPIQSSIFFITTSIAIFMYIIIKLKEIHLISINEVRNIKVAADPEEILKLVKSNYQLDKLFLTIKEEKDDME